MNSIIENLKNSCLEENPKLFIKSLLSENVATNMPNKVRFYKFFKHMLASASLNSTGSWRFIEKEWVLVDQAKIYQFYDTKHKYSRLNIVVIYVGDKLQLQILPF